MCSKCYSSIKNQDDNVSTTTKKGSASGDESTAEKVTSTETAVATVETKTAEFPKNTSESSDISVNAEKSDALSNDEGGADENNPSTDIAAKVIQKMVVCQSK